MRGGGGVYAGAGVGEADEDADLLDVLRVALELVRVGVVADGDADAVELDGVGAPARDCEDVDRGEGPVGGAGRRAFEDAGGVVGEGVGGVEAAEEERLAGEVGRGGEDGVGGDGGRGWLCGWGLRVLDL
jgi:hypothetical protein